MKHKDARLDDHPGEPMAAGAADFRGRAVCRVCHGILRASWSGGRLVEHPDREVLR